MTTLITCNNIQIYNIHRVSLAYLSGCLLNLNRSQLQFHYLVNCYRNEILEKSVAGAFDEEMKSKANYKVTSL